MNIEGNTILLDSPSPKMNWKIIAVVVVILAILGFNIFIYLAKGVNVFAYILEHIMSLMGSVVQLIGKGTDKTLDLTKIGAETIVDDKSNKKRELDKALDEKKSRGKRSVLPNSTDATKIQTGNKKGWCYVGTDRDYRSCLKVNSNDICSSGKLYNTKEQCVHPELR